MVLEDAVWRSGKAILLLDCVAVGLVEYEAAVQNKPTLAGEAVAPRGTERRKGREKRVGAKLIKA